MADIFIKVEKDDIQTSKLGNNIMVQCEGVSLVFTPESLEELVSDYNQIVNLEQDE